MTDKMTSFTIAFLALLCVVLISSCATNQSPGRRDPDVFSLFAGEWGLNRPHPCASNPHVISFSDDRKLMYFKWQHPYYQDSTQDQRRYHVLTHGNDWIALQRVGETILNHAGKPRDWKIYLTSDLNGYRWKLYGMYGTHGKLLMRGVRCEPFEVLDK